MITWTEFQEQQPKLAAVGREQFYQHGIGLGFLATIRRDGGPRVHPVCPVLSPAGLHVLILPGPKRADLRRDGRYSLHTGTFAPPREDDGFAVSGGTAEVTDTATHAAVRDQVLRDRGQLWPDYGDLTLFELLVASCLLTLTQPQDGFPKGPTVWKSPALPGVDGGCPLAQAELRAQPNALCSSNTRRSRPIDDSTIRFRHGVVTAARYAGSSKTAIDEISCSDR